MKQWFTLNLKYFNRTKIKININFKGMSHMYEIIIFTRFYL